MKLYRILSGVGSRLINNLAFYIFGDVYPQKLIRLIEQYELHKLAPDVADEPLAEKGVVPPPPARKGDVARADVPPRPRQRRVAERPAVPEPSRAQVDRRVASKRTASSRGRATSGTAGAASADND